LEQDFGGFELVVPDSVYDLEGLIYKTELVNAVGALRLVATELACDEDDEQCLTTGFDIGKIFTITSEDIDTLLLSDIIAATVGKMLISMGEEFLVIPDDTAVRIAVQVNQQDVFVVAKTEIRNMFLAASILGIDDIENPDFSEAKLLELAEDENNITILLASKIIAATAGKMIYEMGGDMLTIPSAATEIILVSAEEVTIVTEDEIRAVFIAVSTLGLTTFDGLELGPDILGNLALEDDPTVLDEEKANLIFDSLIIHATLSHFLIDMSSGESAVLTIPYFAVDETPVRIMDSIDQMEWIDVLELKAVLRAILILDIEDFELITIDTLDMDVILDNATLILDSAILHATISEQIINIESDMIVVPTHDLDGEPILITSGLLTEETTYISLSEIEAVLEAIKVLNVDMSDPQFDESIIGNLESDTAPGQLDDDKLDRLFESTIIHASLSKMILDMTEGDGESDPILSVPYKDVDNQDIRITRFGYEYIVKTELVSLFKGYYSLDIENFDAIDNIDFDLIIDQFSTLMLSAVLHALISDQVINLDTEMIIVPEKDRAGDDLLIVRGPVGHETTYIDKLELEHMIDAINVLNIDFDNPVFDATIIQQLENDTEDDLDDDKLDILFASVIIHASMSKMLFDLTDDGVLLVPEKDVDNIDVIETYSGIDYISSVEMKALFRAVYVMEIEDFDEVESIDLDKVSEHFDTIILSAVLHATVSDQVINMESDAIVIPDFDLDGEPIIVTRGSGDSLTTYIIRSELRATIDAIELLNIDFDNPVFDATIINNLENDTEDDLDDDKLDILFTSVIIHASMSKMLFDLTDDGVLLVPEKDVDNVDVIETYSGIDYISSVEMKALFRAVYVMEIEDFDEVESIDLDKVSEHFDTIILSAVLHATVS
ncbi:MAG: hypothetical protein PHW40_07710, partial [Candidatus Izemoplasmatales bacterium]|nr:hypothetical protein [Candidatus Izemoplasmatales bacterium]